MAKKSKFRKRQPLSQAEASQNTPPQTSPGDVIGIELRKILVWGVIAAITVYCLLFLMTPFGPLDERMTRPERFLRFDFFTRLLDPGYWYFAWFGDTNTFSLDDAYHIIGLTASIAMMVFAIGFSVLLAFRMTKRLSKCECFVFSSAIGFSILSTILLFVGLFGGLNSLLLKLGLMLCAFAGVLMTWCVLIFYLTKLQYSGVINIKDLPRRLIQSRFNIFVLVLAVPSLLILLFGGMLPPVEYDVTSYHIPGARHFFETGRIDFVSNNVYVNMPFAAEMFYVCGMIMTGDWYVGTLVGKLLIAYCTVLAGLGVYAFGKRLHSARAGLIGFLLYVSLPWVSWVSTAGLIDCMFGMYLLLAVFAMFLYVSSRHNDGTSAAEENPLQNECRPMLYLAGYMAGCAAACKYTAVPFLVLPLGAFALFYVCKRPDALRFRCDKRAVRTLGLFVLSITLACGLWYGKNLVETGNPTYPLMYGLFGDRTDTWDAAKNSRWQAAHSSTDFSAQCLARDAKTVLFGSDWLAPALVPLALLPFLRRRQNRECVALALYLFYYLVLWWLLTHRLERFWVPVLPIAAVLAGVGAMFFAKTIKVSEVQRNKIFGGGHGVTALPFSGAIFIGLLLTFNTCYVFFPDALSAPGKYSRFGFGVDAARLDPARVASPLIPYFNAHPPAGKLLLVGDAEVFDYDVPVLYNTCFDDTPFDALLFETDRDRKTDGAAPRMRSPDEMRRRLKEAGVSHIVVNWSELARFRSPGNYGYTSDLVQPAVFDQLTRLGVLRRVPNVSESPDGIPALSGQVVYEVVP